MRTATAGIFAALALLSACGTTGGKPTVAGGEDDTSAVTVIGAESAIVEHGDNRPEAEGDVVSVVVVTVDLPPAIELAGIVIVALEDITYADAEAIEIAAVMIPVGQLVEQDNKVEVFLPLPLDGSVEVTATVHIDVDESGSFSPGDWISPELAMVTSGSRPEVTVNMVQI